MQSPQWVEEEDTCWDVPDPVACGFEPTQPTEAGWQANAASYIRPDAQDGASSCYQSSLPSRRAPGALLVVERVQRLAKDEVAAVIAGERKISR